MNRRAFLRTGALAGLGLAARQAAAGARPPDTPTPTTIARLLSTHPAGLAANRVAAQVLREGGSALDAVQRGVMVAEADPENTSVGYGGLPNADGVVELDAAIMDGATLNAGAVAGLRDIKQPIASRGGSSSGRRICCWLEKGRAVSRSRRGSPRRICSRRPPARRGRSGSDCRRRPPIPTTRSG